MKFFKCKQFEVRTNDKVFKVGTDATVLGAVVEASHARTALEIGSGTGIVSLMVAQRFPQLTIDAIDSEKDAYELSQTNFQNSIFKERLSAYHSELSVYGKVAEYDLIYTNPPYHTEDHKGSTEMLKTAKSEDSMPVEVLARRVDNLMAHDGRFYVIGPVSYIEILGDELNEDGLSLVQQISIRHKEGSRISRVVGVFARQKKAVDSSEIILYKEGRIFSDQATALLKDFLIVL